MRQFTDKLKANVYDETHYGRITNSDWVDKEVERLNAEYDEVLFFRKDTPGNMVCIMTSLPQREYSPYKN